MTLKRIFFGLFLLFITIFWLSCAQTGNVTGGKRDTIAPVLLAEFPPSFSTNMTKKEVKIQFNEFLQFNKLEDKFIISPPTATMPEVKLKGKKIIVTLPDSLKENTTYTLQFFDIVGDFTENNRAKGLQYVFSTGATCDSLSISGHVYDLHTLKPAIGKLVGAYDLLADSIPKVMPPAYLARTDSNGLYRIPNLPAKKYRIIALDDVNKNQKFDLASEKIGFNDSIYTPSAVHVVIPNSGEKKDSLAPKVAYTFIPSNVDLFVFQEDNVIQSLRAASRKSVGKVELIFAKSYPKIEKIELTDSIGTRFKFNQVQNVTKDTVSLWISDKNAFKEKKISVICNYLAQDSNFNYFSKIDTFLTRFTEENDSAKIIKLNSNIVQSKCDIGDSIRLSSPVAFQLQSDKLLKLYHLRDTTVTDLRVQDIIRHQRTDANTVTLWFARKMPANPIFFSDKKKILVKNIRTTKDSMRFECSFAPGVLPAQLANFEVGFANEYYNKVLRWERKSIAPVYQKQTILRVERPSANRGVLWLAKNSSKAIGLKINGKGSILTQKSLWNNDSLRVEIEFTGEAVAQNLVRMAVEMPDQTQAGNDTLLRSEVAFVLRAQQLLKYSRPTADSIAMFFAAPLQSLPSLDAKGFKAFKNWYEPYISSDSLVFSAKLKRTENAELKNLQVILNFSELNEKLENKLFAFPLNFQQDSVFTFVKPDEKSSKKATAKGTKDGHKIQSLNPMNYTIQQVDAQNLVISAKFKPGQSYRIELDTALVKDLRGRTNDTASWQFVVRKADEYARLRLELKSNLVHPLLFLMDEKGDRIVKKLGYFTDKKLSFDHLIPGNYQLMVLDDRNQNGRWDAGEIRKKSLPERKYIYARVLKLKEGWEVEESWDLSDKKMSFGVPIEAKKKTGTKK